jgi:cytochrome P450
VSRPEFPLHEPDFYRSDPYPAFRSLREQSPVHWHAPGGWWALSRWADIRWVSGQPDLFSNAGGVMIPDPAEIGPDDLDLMLFTDPPRHRQLRRVIKDLFAPRRIRALEPRIRELARSVIDPIPSGAVIDFAEAVAAPLPTIVIAELLGIAGADWDHFRAWSDAIIGELDPAQTGDRAQAQAALHAYFLDVIEERARRPREDDFVSSLLAADVEGQRLTRDEIYCFCWLLLLAGNETTRNLIAQGAHALLLHPDALGQLAAQPQRLPRAIEEMLRWCTPSQYMARTATRDVELRGRKILAGHKVIMLYGAANRDPEVFGADAEEFRITRDPNPHLSFGYGEHVCMGAGLARLEARVLFEELLPRLAGAELAGQVVRLRATMTPGITEMPVRFAA